MGKVKAIIHVYKSKRDINGNTYYSVRYTDTETGKQVCTVIPHSSSVTSAIRYLNLEWENVYYIESEVPKKEFRKMIKDWDECYEAHYEKLANWIKSKLAN